MNSSVFRMLVRHEFLLRGSWKKRGRSPIARKWRYLYALAVVTIVVGMLTWSAINDSFQIEGLWFVTMGFPYMFFFSGTGIVKREWENETQGWWLTLPYSRMTLIGAKWLGLWLRMMAVVLVVYAAALLYTSILAVLFESYNFADVGEFAIAGFNWFVLVIGFGPILLALGALTGILGYTEWRPIMPVLWVVIIGTGGLMYANMSSLFEQLTGERQIVPVPFPWVVWLAMAVSLPVTYLIVRLAAYLLDKKIA